jgi:hypothetical protein
MSHHAINGLSRVVPRGVAVAVALGASLAMPATASAGPPTREHSTSTSTFEVNDICDFSLQDTEKATVTRTTSSDGTSVKAHVAEQDTFSANGHRLRSRRYTFNVHWTFDTGGNLVSAVSTGQVIEVPITRGVTFHAAGRFDYVHVGFHFVVVPESGSSKNQAAFCAALAR